MSAGASPGDGPGTGSGTPRRGDIQGLRAVAVALVVLFHAGVTWLPGGYIGVDVFFVISGFLITGLLAREWERTGQIGLRSFYARRIRRLLPASALVLVATLIAAWLVFPPLAMKNVAEAGAATALYVSNMWFASESTQYLADTAPSPLLHYWSLGVEEHFYLFWPLLLIGIWTLARRGRPSARAAFAILAAVVVASFIFNLWLTRESGPWAFFSLPSRAWELGLGALLALGATRVARLPVTAARVLGIAGLVAIIAAAVLYSEKTPFPGVAATLPVLGTVAILAAGCAWPLAGAGRILSLPAMGFVGGISYSLYLWHWPLLVIPVAYSTRVLSPLATTGLVATAVVLAILTTRFVEDPIRHNRKLALRPLRGFALAGALTVIGLGTAFAVSSGEKLDSGVEVAARPPGVNPAAAPPPETVPANLVPGLDEVDSDRPSSYETGCHADIGDEETKACVYGARRSGPMIALFGDSHLAQWFPAVAALARRNDMPLLNLTGSGCPSVSVTVWSDQLGREDLECDRLRESALAAIERLQPDWVVVSNLSHYGLPEPGLAGDERWAEGLAETLGRLPQGTRITVIEDTPHFKADPPTCLSENLDDPQACSSSRREVFAERRLDLERDVTEAAGGQYVDMSPVLCPQRCQVIAWNLLMYRDHAHITTPYSLALAGELGRRMGMNRVPADRLALGRPSNGPGTGV